MEKATTAPKTKKIRPSSRKAAKIATHTAINPMKQKLIEHTPRLREEEKFSYKYLHYMHTLLDPDCTTACRVPDELTTPTVTYKSITRQVINLDYTANPSGEFAILVQPKLGNVTTSQNDPNKSFITYSKPSANDLTVNANYNYLNDKNLVNLSSPSNTIYQYSAQNIGALQAPVYPQLNSVLYPKSAISSLAYSGQTLPHSMDLTWQTYVPSSGNIPILSGVDGNGTSIAGFPYNNATTGFLSPWFSGISGWHDIYPYVVNTGTGATIGSNSVKFIEMDISTKQVTGWAQSQSGTVDVWAGTFLDSGNFYREAMWGNPSHAFDWPSNTVAATQSLFFNVLFRVNLDPTKMYQVLFGFNYVNPVPPNSIIQNLSIYTTPIPTANAVNSLLEKARPVACSALLHPIAPAITMGGQLMAVSANSGQLLSIWNDTNNRRFSDLSALAIEKGSNSFSVSEGAYAYWIPTDVSARELLSVSEMSNKDYGGFIFSGYVSPSTLGPPTSLNAFMLTVVVHYEYTSTSRILTQYPCKGDLEKFSKVMSIAGTAEKVFANKSHASKIQEILGRAMFPLSNFFPGKTLKERVGKSFKFGMDSLKYIPGLEGADDVIAAANGLLEFAMK